MAIEILAKVLEYCEKHADAAAANNERKAWDADFVKVELHTLYGLSSAVEFLKIKNLLKLTCRPVVDMITGKTPEQIRRTFDIKNDFNRGRAGGFYFRQRKNTVFNKTITRRGEDKREKQWALE
ncbi:hypothetical protein DITRI_Ditri08aG0149800 [Diplodiscus trichospermus]